MKEKYKLYFVFYGHKLPKVNLINAIVCKKSNFKGDIRQKHKPYDPRVGCKSCRVVRKSAGKWWVGYEIPDRYNYRQAVMTFPTRRRFGDVFYTASRRSITTSPKPLTDKPDDKQTSLTDKQTSQEHVPDPSR